MQNGNFLLRCRRRLVANLDGPLLLIVVGIFGGVLVFGFIGLFLGPMLLALGQVLIREWLAITEYDEQPSI